MYLCPVKLSQPIIRDGQLAASSRRTSIGHSNGLGYGGQLVFNDVPTPTIARDEILVNINSTAVNHVDLVKTARQILPIDLPWIAAHQRMMACLEWQHAVISQPR